jgi:hypothetical protein
VPYAQWVARNKNGFGNFAWFGREVKVHEWKFCAAKLLPKAGLNPNIGHKHFRVAELLFGHGKKANSGNGTHFKS